ncbi:MAG: DegT/DnrJ/EryC1/StrS family aminotransferase [Thermoguttaceae bacterium]
MNPTTDKTGRDTSERPVPLLDLGRQNAELKDEIAARLARVYDSGAFVLGPEVTELEKNVAAYCQTAHAVGCASGSDALLLALMAYEIGPGDEVILPSFTFFATASAVTRLGATPIFADIDPETFNIDPAAVERSLSPAVQAIIPVHLFGQCARMDALHGISKATGIPIIEDAAQAIGAEWDGRRAGSLGQIGCLSFYPTKNLGGAGDGGMLTTNCDELADRLRLLRGHGMRPRYYHGVVGINSRLDSFQAAVLNVKLPHLDRYTTLRQANAQRYTEMFAAAGLDREIKLPQAGPQMRHVWNQYVVRIPDGRRDALRAFLAEAHVGSEIYYPLGLHQQECFRHLQYAEDALPETLRASEEVLALPIFPELTEDEQARVVDRIGAFMQKGTGGHSLPGPIFLRHPAMEKKATDD